MSVKLFPDLRVLILSSSAGTCPRTPNRDLIPEDHLMATARDSEAADMHRIYRFQYFHLLDIWIRHAAG
jgi:hypothetical protein